MLDLVVKNARFDLKMLDLIGNNARFDFLKIRHFIWIFKHSDECCVIR